jgi:hypothetical protein
MLLIKRDECSHEPKQLVGEERVERAVVDTHGLAIDDVDGGESCLVEVPDEVTLRQRASSSAGPGRWMGEHLRRELIVDGQIGNT